MKCKLHDELWYVGSTVDLRSRWAGHKSDCKLKLNKKCKVADHVNTVSHPTDPKFTYLCIAAIDKVPTKDRLLERENYWRANLGTMFVGLNRRNDIHTTLRHRIHYTS